MPKKPQQQAESNNAALSREDRKNEQICRMIERAEKQRLKREQKKKLAVLNKASGKVGSGSGVVPRKTKKIGLLSTKRTQVAIRILFNESVRQQNTQNRYFFERKQTIEEKQRMEQDEMWTRYTLRVQQSQQAAAAMAASQSQLQQQSSHLPAMHDNLSTVPDNNNNILNHQSSQQQQQQIYSTTTNQSYGGVHHHRPTMQQATGINNRLVNNNNNEQQQQQYRCNYLPQQQQSQSQQHLLVANAASSSQQQNPSAGAYQQALATSTALAVATSEQQFYLNDGATGGNYEAGIEDQSGSSYFSSASKRAMYQQQSTQQNPNNLAGQDGMAQPQLVQMQQMSFGVGAGHGAPLPTAFSEPATAQPLLVPAQPQKSLGSILNGLQQQRSNISIEEEAKVGAAQAIGTITSANLLNKAALTPPSASGKSQIKIDVNLNLGATTTGKTDVNEENKVTRSNQNKPSTNMADPATDTTLRHKQSSQQEAGGVVVEKTEEQRILELTRQQMQRRKSPTK